MVIGDEHYTWVSATGVFFFTVQDEETGTGIKDGTPGSLQLVVFHRAKGTELVHEEVGVVSVVRRHFVFGLMIELDCGESPPRSRSMD